MKKIEKPSQKKMILQALRSGRKLTGLMIIHEFGCLNYRARISELRQLGEPIKTEMITTKSGKRISLYSLQK